MKYIGMAQPGGPKGPGNSGWKNTIQEVQAWGAKYLADNPQTEAILVAEIVGKVERTTPPIRFVTVDELTAPTYGNGTARVIEHEGFNT